MMTRLPEHYGDETCSAFVRAGDHIYLSHHGGAHESGDVAAQARAGFNGLAETLAAAGAELADMVQITLYLRRIEDFKAARAVFEEFFAPGQFPARMTATTDFVDPRCLCQIDGVAYSRRP